MSTDSQKHGQDPSKDVVARGHDEGAPVEVIGERRGMFGVSDTGDTSGYGGLRRPVELPGASTPPYGG